MSHVWKQLLKNLLPGWRNSDKLHIFPWKILKTGLIILSFNFFKLAQGCKISMDLVTFLVGNNLQYFDFLQGYMIYPSLGSVKLDRVKYNIFKMLVFIHYWPIWCTLMKKIIMIVHYMHVKAMYLNIVNNLLIYKVIKFYKAFYFVVWYKQISLMRLSIIRIFELAKPLQKISSKNVSEMSRSALTYISYMYHYLFRFERLFE